MPLLGGEVTPESAELFRDILGCHGNLGVILRSMFRTGVLEILVPPMAHARCLLQFNQYHSYTVDEHTLRTIEQLERFDRDAGALGTAYRNVRKKYLLHLAMLLPIAVGMRGTLSRLPVALKAEAKPSQQPADQFLAGSETALSKPADEAALAPADPPQGRLGIATDRRLDQFLQCVQQSGLSLDLRLAAAARPANTARQLGIVASQLRKTTPDCTARDPRRLRHSRDTAPACR